MTGNHQPKPRLWLVDSECSPLAACHGAIEPWADIIYFPSEAARRDWDAAPDAVLFSAEMPGGPEGGPFRDLLETAGNIPLIAVARLRSLAQAVAYFRAGVTDYLSLPLEEDDARGRVEAAFERAAALSMRGMMVELQPVDPDPGEVSLTLKPSQPPAAGEDDDILATLNPVNQDDDVAPVAVDGLPIPSLWDELPCGIAVFDSSSNLVFSNAPALGLFGFATLPELQEALENRRANFKAHAANHHPLPDNQWPHILAGKTRAARAAVISIEKPDRRRSWLRVDCMPHLHDGQMTRLCMTVVNLTGELPPLAATGTAPAAAKSGAGKGKSRGKRK